ncbi:retropepsin-like aspartic peptidase RloA2 [Metapseudomonas furukawaii]|uniref:Ribosomal protein S6 glutaminyl transferase n=1 Tax=Metapseudomonas furukawaii TaxID=1149133 RepID=A0AAD1FDL4_METFU|nr:ATP-dependent zinc protease [Pseudomonas furukawaii]ELS27357.1 Ribosomal protein S6 glutaminyl transferase [Pseudomonas furukawaii]BAU72102.1 ribosomal protein S6 glutaminyl transferase [Pseudomonas furukawaii]
MKALIALLALVALPALANQEPALYGRYEYVKLPEIGQTLKAKMDTGALTASLSARDIELFKRDGEEWVRFRLATKDADDTLYEHRLARISKIKNRADELADEDEAPSAEISRRPVVDLEMCLGGTRRTVEVNLTDRSSFNYPLLIGAKALKEFKAAIYAGHKFTAGKPQC